ncbi:hypothetical protein SAMN04488522_102830 [Pedobacter caeni]|uniref:Uncharacterized protein n=1 Tax=Pedobacter caeni TaxID=288992 RepID=A0A1M5AP45_9SPHI|nr:hypothetical protein SAMN04488522_102830 [Pedobacter caeni]
MTAMVLNGLIRMLYFYQSMGLGQEYILFNKHAFKCIYNNLVHTTICFIFVDYNISNEKCR